MLERPSLDTLYPVPQAHQAYLRNQLPDLLTPSAINKNIHPNNQHHTGSFPNYNHESTFNAAINLLNLNTRTIPPTPANLVASTYSLSGNLLTTQSSEPNLHAPYTTMQQNQTGHASKFPNFFARPPWIPPENSNLKWAWIERNGPYITNGQCHSPYAEASNTKSDTTVVMFNLDCLNEEKPEILQGNTWRKGHILESPNSFKDSLIQRVNRGRFNFEMGSSSNGPRLVPS